MSASRVLWCQVDVWSLKVSVWLVPPSSREIQGQVGLWDGSKCEIYISWALTKEMAESTLVHELAHAGIDAAGTSLAETSVKDKEVSEGEETAVNLIAAVIYGSLKQNGMLKFPPRPWTPADHAKVREANKARMPKKKTPTKRRRKR